MYQLCPILEMRSRQPNLLTQLSTQLLYIFIHSLLCASKLNIHNLVMESSSHHQSSSSSCSPHSKPLTLSFISPCAACKVLRRRCSATCVLAPYFPPTELLKFMIAHRVFGASNIIKLLQVLPLPKQPMFTRARTYTNQKLKLCPSILQFSDFWKCLTK